MEIRERTNFEIGEEASLEHTFTQQDVEDFARLTGDTNPVHLDEQYAASTRFHGRIVHGALVASLMSAVLGTKLPGPGAIYSSQLLKFKAPVRVGDRLRALARVLEWDPEKGRITIGTDVYCGETVVLTGEARLSMLSFLK
jgi:3-hydroxybutyryl-CoA dehydratase